jgi:hypothetical protein
LQRECPLMTQSEHLLYREAHLYRTTDKKTNFVRAGNFARLSPRDSLALKGGKQFGIVSVDILAEIRDAIIGPSCQVCDVNG